MRLARTHRQSGFTLVEAMVVVAIVAILGGAVYGVASRARPRATFDGVGAEIQSLFHSARQQALSAGIPVAVLVFPDYRGGGSQGRLVVIQDDPAPASSLFNAAATLNFDNYDPGSMKSPPAGQLLGTLDLPDGVGVGPSTGLGVASLPFPYDRIATNVACSFCNSGGNHRGAVVFDSQGRATFLRAVATPSGDASGASFSIQAADLANAPATTFVITTATGAIRTFHNG